ncbi:hypothetical protein N7474_010482 [Penicillium riverlandense]|uniref:uncharacterized protein n=1 Tax=Penicillium riverlandense TaxID=1903569 RepID=UPI0025486D31|nr:uncharacterized protein N7474_010482 [Penicillium riverlandense]KAJ5806890.1 hypothetical protein N7474_010482 [Penicillium riverlandense]
MPSTLSAILPFIGWGFLPGYATSFLQSIYYGLTIRAGEPRPPPQSPRYQKHRRRIYIVVIVGYLLYTLLETFRQVQSDGDFYEVLEVSPFAEERTIKSRFRKLAAQHHPDKTGFDNDSDAYFIFLRGAQETLVDPVKRFAYDRFGPEMQNWGPQKTMRDYIMTSITRSIFPQYFGGLLFMMVLNWLWWPNRGRYWRFYTLAAMLTLELFIITHPQAVFMPGAYLPAALQSWIPGATRYLLPFQILTLARRASITMHIFISQIGPRMDTATGTGDKLSQQTMQRLGQVVALSRAADVEATRTLQLGLVPFRGDREIVSTLRRGMKEGLILAGVRSSPEVQRAVAQVTERWKAEKAD